MITSSSPFPPSLEQIADKIAPDMEPHRWVASTYRATVERKGRTYRVTTDRTNINNDALVTVHRSAAVAARTVHNWLEHRVRKVIK